MCTHSLTGKPGTTFGPGKLATGSYYLNLITWTVSITNTYKEFTFNTENRTQGIITSCYPVFTTNQSFNSNSRKTIHTALPVNWEIDFFDICHYINKGSTLKYEISSTALSSTSILDASRMVTGNTYRFDLSNSVGILKVNHNIITGNIPCLNSSSFCWYIIKI